MKILSRLLFVFGVVAFGFDCQAQQAKYVPRDGDIIFQTSQSRQSIAVQKATKSPYSHMGIVYVRDGRAVVFEGVGPVKSTPLGEWTARGKDGRFVVKRLKDAGKLLTTDTLKRMRNEGKKIEGKPYDSYFEWSDERIYCSELVWKVYQRGAGIELGKLQKMDDFDLSAPEVKDKIKERFGDKPPLSEKVIAPVTIFDMPLLVTVFSNERKQDAAPDSRRKNKLHRSGFARN